MLTSTCSAFVFTNEKSCRLYDAPYLYKDVSDNNGNEVYMEDTLWAQRGNVVDFVVSDQIISNNYKDDILVNDKC